MVELAQIHTYIQFWNSSIEILFRVYLLPFIGSKWFSEFSQTYLCRRGKRKPSFILSGSDNKEKSIQCLLFHCKKIFISYFSSIYIIYEMSIHSEIKVITKQIYFKFQIVLLCTITRVCQRSNFTYGHEC